MSQEAFNCRWTHVCPVWYPRSPGLHPPCHLQLLSWLESSLSPDRLGQSLGNDWSTEYIILPQILTLSLTIQWISSLLFIWPVHTQQAIIMPLYFKTTSPAMLETSRQSTPFSVHHPITMPLFTFMTILCCSVLFSPGGLFHLNAWLGHYNAFRKIIDQVGHCVTWCSDAEAAHCRRTQGDDHSIVFQSSLPSKLAQSSTLPPAIYECKILLEWAYGSEAHSNINDNVPIPVTVVPIQVPQDLFRLIHQRSAVLHIHVKHVGVVYSQSSTHIGNSLIMFYPQGSHMSLPVPGCIKYIYGSEGTLIFAIQWQCPLPVLDTEQDPFSIYPYFPAKFVRKT